MGNHRGPKGAWGVCVCVGGGGGGEKKKKGVRA